MPNTNEMAKIGPTAVGDDEAYTAMATAQPTSPSRPSEAM